MEKGFIFEGKKTEITCQWYVSIMVTITGKYI